MGTFPPTRTTSTPCRTIADKELRDVCCGQHNCLVSQQMRRAVDTGLVLKSKLVKRSVMFDGGCIDV
jgi:hypothetical protein